MPIPQAEVDERWRTAHEGPYQGASGMTDHPIRQSQVPEEIALLEKHLDVLVSQMHMLTERLFPVLHPIELTGQPTPDVPCPPLAPLAEKLASIRALVESCHLHLMHLRERLEV